MLGAHRWVLIGCPSASNPLPCRRVVPAAPYGRGRDAWLRGALPNVPRSRRGPRRGRGARRHAGPAGRPAGVPPSRGTGPTRGATHRDPAATARRPPRAVARRCPRRTGRGPDGEELTAGRAACTRRTCGPDPIPWQRGGSWSPGHGRGAARGPVDDSLPRRSVIRDRPTPRGYRSAARGPAGAAPSGPSAAAPPSSERMSMRHPVSFAARRAFCPSLPIARESWKSGRRRARRVPPRRPP